MTGPVQWPCDAYLGRLALETHLQPCSRIGMQCRKTFWTASQLHAGFSCDRSCAMALTCVSGNAGVGNPVAALQQKGVCVCAVTRPSGAHPSGWPPTCMQTSAMTGPVGWGCDASWCKQRRALSCHISRTLLRCSGMGGSRCNTLPTSEPRPHKGC